MKIAEILLTLIFIVLVIIWYYVWNIDSRMGEMSADIGSQIGQMSADIDSINTTLNKWFEASLGKEDLDYIINWLK